MLNTTGLDSAVHIPVGATLTKAYWVLAESYGPGADRESEAAAIQAGIDRMKGYQASHVQAHGEAYATAHPHPEAFSVDLRWKMDFPRPQGGGMEFTIRRTHYASIAEAQAHLDRKAKYAPVGA